MTLHSAGKSSSTGQLTAQEPAMARSRLPSDRLDDAARAGWLYYIASKTQDEIAAQMGISRQAAQRLVSLAISERLVRVSMLHPIARCLELAEALKARFAMKQAEVVPADAAVDGGTTGLGEAGAAEIGRWLRRALLRARSVAGFSMPKGGSCWAARTRAPRARRCLCVPTPR
jgi:DNA-binding transcriptional regulator LsrR (DeoR family)